MASPDVIVIPTPSALGKYNLSRFVGTQAYNGKQNNPFVTVNGQSAMPKVGDDNNDRNFFMNEVILEAFEYQPVRITTKTVNGMVQASLDYGGGSQSNAPNLLASFRLLLDNDKGVGVEYKHAWESPPGSKLSGLYNDVNGLSAKLAMKATEASNALARVGADQSYRSEPIKRIDYQKIYTDTEFPEVTINFTAFTNDNFIGDIYIPIMALCAFTHPKRFTGEDSGGGGADDGWWQSTLATVNKVVNAGETIIADAGQKLNETLALTARQYTLKPPCLFNIYHQSGIYTYSSCMCTNIKVDYEGPWYNATAPEQQIFDVFSKGPMKLNLNRRSFPTIARVSMTFTTNERITRDDFQFILGSFSKIANSGDTTFTKFGNNS